MIHCFYCDIALNRNGKPRCHPTKDHITPKCRGGANIKENRVNSCPVCNNDKGGLTLEEYRVVIAFRQGILKPPKEFYFPGESRVAPIQEPKKVENKARKET